MLARAPAPGEDVTLFMREPLGFVPGAKFEYNNANYRLLVKVIEKLTGESYEQALHQRILDPVGMSDSGLAHDWLATLCVAIGYWMMRQGKLERALVVNGGWSSGDGGIFSTVLDLEKYSEAFASGKLIPR